MLILECDKIKKYYGDRLILDIDNLKVYSEDRIGIVGLNGAGKTTLLDILSGKVKADEGIIQLNGSYSYITQLETAEGDRVEKQVARKFGVENVLQDYFSGGEKTRLKIAQSLCSDSSIIFADEPTSNLDIPGVTLLENELKVYKGALLIISHDREFLDKLCNKIIEIQDGKIKVYNGNYSSYKQQKEMERERAQFEYEQFTNEIRRLEEAIEEKQNKVKSMKKAPSRMGNSEARLHKMGNQKAQANLDRARKNIEARIEHMEKKERPQKLQKTMVDINERDSLHSRILISGKGINKSFGRRVIFTNADFDIYNGSKIALIGGNGSGKTTLIRMIMEGCGDIRIAQGVKIGYFSQELDILDQDSSIIDNVLRDSVYDETFVRITLARLLFKREEIYKKIRVLSGGERVKVSFAKIFLSDINLLILDEPTNYLDIFSTEAIEAAVKEYQGTVLFVSHDRKFVNAIADHLLVIENNKLTAFNGNYDDYIEKKNNIFSVQKEDKQKLRMILENRLSEIIGRLSIPSRNDDMEALDKEYKRVLEELRCLKNSK